MEKVMQENYLFDCISKAPTGWENVWEESSHNFRDIAKTLYEKGDFFPAPEELYTTFEFVRPENVKVVIVGQDPYHQEVKINGNLLPRAVGCSFSVRDGDSIPSSLLNIFKELKKSLKDYERPETGDLLGWSHQGVLLLNICLTVSKGKPKSHEQEIWSGLIDNVLNEIAKQNPRCIFALWGKDAQSIKTRIGKKSVVLETSHPSGYSYNRGFNGCNHFPEINKILKSQGKTPIIWEKSEIKSFI